MSRRGLDVRWLGVLDAALETAKSNFDLTDEADRRSLDELTARLLRLPADGVADAARRDDVPLEFAIAAKLVASRRLMDTIMRPIQVAVVFAMWGEHNRLRPRTADNPHGEDALRVKLDQLDWITRGTPVSWHLYAVDDGDPNDSGGLAAQIAADHPLGDRVTVLWLDRELPTEEGPLAALASADDSRKGGAVILGCDRALADGADAVVYTDADNSVHLGQLGLLLEPYVRGSSRVLLGNRKHPDAVLVKQEGRWGIGIKVLRHMQRMIGAAIFSRGIGDTQAAFKLYDAALLREIIAEPTVYDFSFDTDWILAAIARGESFDQIPFAFIDSAAESASVAQGPMTTWETLLKGLTEAVRKHGVEHDEDMARVLDEEIHDHRDLELLIDRLPPELEAASDADLGDPAVMSPAALQAWIQSVKRDAAV